MSFLAGAICHWIHHRLASACITSLSSINIFAVLARGLIVIRMSPKRFQGTPEPEEETPLLRDGNAPRTETPLPMTQILVLLLLQLCEPITSHSIKPYINQVRSSIPTS